MTSFVTLLLCYVVLLDWRAISGWLGHGIAQPSAAIMPPSAASDRGASSVWPAACLGTALVVTMGIQGARHAVDAWPFGCYPTFDRLLGDTLLDLRIEALAPGGSARAIPDGPSTHGRRRSPQDWARAWQLCGLYGSAPQPAQLREYLRYLMRDAQAAAVARSARSLRFYVAVYAVAPDHWGNPRCASGCCSRRRPMTENERNALVENPPRSVS